MPQLQNEPRKHFNTVKILSTLKNASEQWRIVDILKLNEETWLQKPYKRRYDIFKTKLVLYQISQ